MQSTANGKRIAKNTIMLYIRMLLTMAVTLYTTRVVLRTLGAEDYGIYNVVGGIVAMFGFLNTSMVASSQRFLSYSLGRNDIGQVRTVFSNSLFIHIIIAVVILILAETLGLWYVTNKLVIPDGRLSATLWVYQTSIFVFILYVLRVPDNAAIIAYEHMSAYAYLSIAEVVLKLLIVFLLPILTYDKLVVYSILVLLVSIIVTVIYRIYVNTKFKELIFIPRYDRTFFREMTFFAGWSLCGNVSYSMSRYGLNIVLNLFFGTIINAARGIAYQVQAAIAGFGSNFLVAVNPQIVKSYAAQDFDYMKKLVFRASKFSFILMFLVSLPLINNKDYILKLWLGDYPEHTSSFVFLIIIDSIINIITDPFQSAITATGKIKFYQILVGIIMISNLPIAYFLLCSGASVYAPFITTIILTIILMFVRLLIFKKQTSLPISSFFTNVLPRIVLIVLLSSILTKLLGLTSAQNFIHLILYSMATLFIILTVSYYCGLDKDERILIKSKINNIFQRTKVLDR